MAGQLNLKLTRLSADERLVIGKFRDPPKLDSIQGTIHMQEDLEDDIQDISEEAYGETKGAEYYKRRRKNRFRRKTQITIEQETRKFKDGQAGLRYIGAPIEPKTEGGNTSKYMLFEIVKGADLPEVHVTPVDDWYQFSKATTSKIISLDEVDLQYDNLRSSNNLSNKKYQRISRAMEQNTKYYEENVLGKFGMSSADDNSSQGKSGRKSVSDIFGITANKLKKGNRKSGGGGLSEVFGDDGDGGREGNADEGGAEGDVGEEPYDEEGMDEVVSDDEEDATIEMAQGALEAERAGVVDEDDGDDEGDDDEDEAEEGEDASGGELVQAAKELKGFLMKQAEKGAVSDADSSDERDQEQEGVGSATGGGADDKKRRREDGKGPSESGKKARTEASDRQGTGGAPVEKEWDLSEEGIRGYMTVMGGRMKIKDLSQAFKKQIRDAGDAGRDRFKAIIVKVAAITEDPVLGKIFVLKQR